VLDGQSLEDWAREFTEKLTHGFPRRSIPSTQFPGLSTGDHPLIQDFDNMVSWWAHG